MQTRITIAELPEYRRRAKRLLTTVENDALVDHLARYPFAGDLIPETGGVRKLRWAQDGRGTRGGVRVIYYICNERLPLYLITVFAKNEQADLSGADRIAIRKLVAILKQHAGAIA